MKFLVPNYRCLQNAWLVGYVPRSLFSLSSVLNWICWTPPEQNFWVRHWFPLRKFGTHAQRQLQTQWICGHLVCRTSFLVSYPYLTLSKMLGFSRSRTPNIMAWWWGVRQFLTSVYSMLSITFLWLFRRFFDQAVSVGLWTNHGTWYRQQLLSWGLYLNTHRAQIELINQRWPSRSMWRVMEPIMKTSTYHETTWPGNTETFLFSDYLWTKKRGLYFGQCGIWKRKSIVEIVITVRQ